MRVRLTNPTLQDLLCIPDYIGLEDPLAANRVAVQIIAACDRLEYLPQRGRPGQVPGTRELVALWPYVIVYHVMPDEVQILRIWHGAQNHQGGLDGE